MSEAMHHESEGIHPSVHAELDTSSELSRYQPRVVIYGQFPYRHDAGTGKTSGGAFSGATEIASALELYLDENGMSHEGVVLSRQRGNIENAFFRAKRHGNKENSPEPAPDSIPDVVFVLPVMRDYDSGAFTLVTPVNEIEDLCQKHGVPMVVVDESFTPELLASCLAQLPGSLVASIGSGEATD